MYLPKLPEWRVRTDLVGWVRKDSVPGGNEDDNISDHPYRKIVEVYEMDRQPRPVAFDVAHREGRVHRVVHI